MNRVVVLGAVLSLLPACAHREAVEDPVLSAQLDQLGRKPESIRIYDAGSAPPGYQVAGFAQTYKEDPDEALWALRRQAVGMGGEALVDVRRIPSGTSRSFFAPLCGNVVGSTEAEMTWTAKVVFWERAKAPNPAGTPAP